VRRALSEAPALALALRPQAEIPALTTGRFVIVVTVTLGPPPQVDDLLKLATCVAPKFESL